MVLVVLIVGILSAIAAPKMFDTATDARLNATRQSLVIIRNAIELYRSQNGGLPGDKGTAGDFKSDLTPYLQGRFPENQLPGPSEPRKVKMETTGAPLKPGGSRGWRYDNVTGEFIINVSGYEKY